MNKEETYKVVINEEISKADKKIEELLTQLKETKETIMAEIEALQAKSVYYADLLDKIEAMQQDEPEEEKPEKVEEEGKYHLKCQCCGKDFRAKSGAVRICNECKAAGLKPPSKDSMRKEMIREENKADKVKQGENDIKSVAAEIMAMG
jgi:small-conductance mechanosensitive channel